MQAKCQDVCDSGELRGRNKTASETNVYKGREVTMYQVGRRIRVYYFQPSVPSLLPFSRFSFVRPLLLGFFLGRSE